VLRSRSSPAEDRALRAVLYHSGAELVTDWPSIFAGRGFRVVESRDIITATLPTWEHVMAVYQRRDGEVIRRYGKRLADRILTHLEPIPGILATRGSFPVLCAQKPQQPKQPNRPWGPLIRFRPQFGTLRATDASLAPSRR
jgi:hypothetical protein